MSPPVAKNSIPRLEQLEPRTVFALFTVSSAADTGPGSLRQAVADAAAFPGADSVAFAPGLFGQTIRLASELAVSDADGVTVRGSPGILISGDTNADGVGDTRLFSVSGKAVFDGLHLTDGRITLSGFGWGGGVFCTGTLSIIGSSITNCSADVGGGLFCFGGALTIDRCFITGNSATRGGGVGCESAGTLTVIDTTIKDNTATGSGGGLFTNTNSGAVSLTRVTIVDNSTNGTVGGVGNFSFQPMTITACTIQGNTGAGVHSNEAGSLVIQSSTISGNSGVGIFHRYGGLTITGSTISGNDGAGVLIRDGDPSFDLIASSTIAGNGTATGAGGVHVISGSVRLSSAIVAGNGTDVIGSAAPGGSQFNLIGDAAFAGGLVHGADGNIVGNAGSGTIPIASVLAPLADNGGRTKTHALVASGPAVNAGANPLGLTTDQRGEGFVRQVGAQPDIGALEFNPDPRPTALVAINQGAAQRSRVTGLTVTFSHPVVFTGGATAALQLQRTGPGGLVGSVQLDIAQAGNTVMIAFNDTSFAGPAGLIDGRYTLTLLATKIVGAGGPLDGNGDGIGGDNQVVAFHRLFGDNDGDADVDAQDFAAFRGAFGGVTNLAFDADGDGDVDATDFGAFRQRFGVSV